MVNKYFGGEILEPGEKDSFDDELIQLALKTPILVEEKMAELRVADAIGEIFTLLRRSNKYIDETTPWILGKDENKKGRLASVLYNLLESIRFAAVMLQPYMPDTAAAILEQLNTDVNSWESLKTFEGIKVGDSVGKAKILFARLETEKKLAEIKSVEDKKIKPVPKEEPIAFDDFTKVKLRSAKVLEVEKIKGADKLLKLIVDAGSEKRQIVSGIATYYEAKELIGKNVVIVSNLAPIKLRGVLSEGMILSAEDDSGLSIVTLDKDAEPGSPVK